MAIAYKTQSKLKGDKVKSHWYFSDTFDNQHLKTILELIVYSTLCKVGAVIKYKHKIMQETHSIQLSQRKRRSYIISVWKNVYLFINLVNHVIPPNNIPRKSLYFYSCF